jgi:hypothetical protein
MQKFDIQAMVRNACGFKARPRTSTAAQIEDMGGAVSDQPQASSRGKEADALSAMRKCNQISSGATEQKSRLRAALSALGPDWTPDFKLPPDLDMLNELVDLGLAQKEEVVDRDNKLIVIYTRYRRMPLKVVA